MFPRELYLQHLAVSSEKVFFCQTVMAGVLPYKIKKSLSILQLKTESTIHIKDSMHLICFRLNVSLKVLQYCKQLTLLGFFF